MPAPSQRRLILASASPRRRELLARLGWVFDVVTADVTEHEAHDADPRAMVAHNAALKAEWVAARHPEAIVLGADTTVFIGRTVLNKPRDAAGARAMLRMLAGRTHTVFTGLAVRSAGLRLEGGAASEVTFKPFGDDVIEAYLARVHTLDKAGGYAIQEHGDLIVAGYTGSLTNIVGLPLEETKQILTQAGLSG
jgi:septum formation protein